MLRHLELERVVNRIGYASVRRSCLYAEGGLAARRLSGSKPIAPSHIFNASAKDMPGTRFSPLIFPVIAPVSPGCGTLSRQLRRK